MTISLGSNIASLRTQRRLAVRTYSLNTRFERLSSGKRINKASDDAAGLSISEQLKGNVAVYDQAVRNLNDGISVLTIIDSAFREITNILNRQIELAEQAANGTYSNRQRTSLDKEARQLTEEYNRIIATTKFNGIGLLDGTLTEDGLVFQAGYGVDETLRLQIGRAAPYGDGTFDSANPLNVATSGSPSTATAGDLDLIVNGESTETVQLFFNDGSGSFTGGTVFSTTHNPRAVRTGDFNNDGVLDLAVSTDETGPPGYFRVRLGDGSGGFLAETLTNVGTNSDPYEFEVLDLNLNGGSGDNFDDIIGVLNNTSAREVIVLLGNGTGNFSTQTYNVGGRPIDVEAGDITGDGITDFAVATTNGGFAYASGNADGTFNAVTQINPGLNLTERRMSKSECNVLS
jgi:flagellin